MEPQQKPPDPQFAKLRGLAEQKLKAIIQTIAKAQGKQLPSESQMPAKSKEELVAIIAPVADKGPDAIVDALATAGCVEVKAPGATEGGDKGAMGAEGGDAGAAAGGGAPPDFGAMPMADARKDAVAAAMK